MEGWNLTDSRAVVIGVSGASGAPIAVRVVGALADAGVPVALVVSDGARTVLREESGIEVAALSARATRTFDDHDLTAPIASGSVPTRGMAIVPASMNTVAKVALGLGDSLLLRAAQVHLKERRPLVVVPRETPVSAIHLRHLATLAELGAIVLPASPPYYTHPKSVDDQTDFLAGKVLDQFGVAHTLYRGWKGGAV
ncbi:MAG: UbiX family flavin prenyltransferase [Thermoplasmata archaeon]|nr:UbiX family flavin prenyltransferase [Thermoplasmata archaeon]